MAYPRTFTFAAGGAYSGLATVGYRLVAAGTAYTAATRVTAGVSEMPPSFGCYVALVSVPDGFQGHILWDTGGGSPAFSVPEEVNPRGNAELLDAAVSGVGAQVLGTPGNKLSTDSFGRVTAQTVANPVTVGTNNDKTGYSLATAPPTAADVAAAVWSFAGRTLAVFGDSAGITTLLGRLTFARSEKLDLLDASVSSRSTYAGGDTPGTTTLLGRIAAALNITGGKVDVATLPNPAPAGYGGGAGSTDLTPVLDAIADLGAPQQAGQAVTLPNPAPPGYGGSGGGSGALTPEEHAKLMGLGALAVTRLTPVGAGGLITIRHDYAYKAAHDNAIAPFRISGRDLAGASVELRLLNGPTLGSAIKTQDGEDWIVAVDVDDGETAALAPGRSWTYLLAAIYPDGLATDPVELLSGTLKVI